MAKSSASEFILASSVLAIFVVSSFAALGKLLEIAIVGGSSGILLLLWGVLKSDSFKRVHFTFGVGITGIIVFLAINILNTMGVTQAIGLGIWAAYVFFGVSTVQFAARH